MTVKSGVMVDDVNQSYSVIMIENPLTGGFASIVNMQSGQHLVPTQIANLDRRLKVKSPFFSLPG